MTIFTTFNGWLERLALRVLTRGARRVLVMTGTDSVLLVRDGTFIPMLATAEGADATTHSTLGAIWIASAVRVLSDATGITDLRSAMAHVMTAAEMPMALVETLLGAFVEAETAQTPAPAVDAASIRAENIAVGKISRDQLAPEIQAQLRADETRSIFVGPQNTTREGVQ